MAGIRQALIASKAVACLLGGLLAVAAAVLLAGCGDGSAAGSSSSIVATVAPSGSEASSGAVGSTGRDDLDHEKEVAWTRYEIVSDQEIRVFFWNGDDRCYGARAEVEEDADSVRVSVFTGTIPGAPAECILVAREDSLVVSTEEPVGSRSVVGL
jgi:hypothetical protein